MKNKEFLETNQPRSKTKEVFCSFHFNLKVKNRNFVIWIPDFSGMTFSKETSRPCLGELFSIKDRYFLKYRVKAINLQETLIVLAIIGILLLLALPNLMPLIAKAKSVEAQVQLKAIYNAQTTHRYMYSKYTNNMEELDFEAPSTVEEGGTANYRYEILAADNAAFKAKATAVTDFDGDGIMNVWEIDENGNPKQTVKD